MLYMIPPRMKVIKTKTTLVPFDSLISLIGRLRVTLDFLKEEDIIKMPTTQNYDEDNLENEDVNKSKS